MSARLIALLMTWVVVGGGPAFATAQDSNSDLGSGFSLTNFLTPGILEERVAALSNRTDLAPQILQDAQECIRLRDALRRTASDRAKLLQATSSASNRLAELNRRLAEPTSADAAEPLAGLTSSALEQQLAEIRAELELARAESERLAEEPKRRTQRRVAIAGLLADYRQQIDQLNSEAADLAAGELPAEVSEIQLVKNGLAKELALQESRNLNLELAGYEATADLLTAQQSAARRRAAFLAKQAESLQDALHRRRAEETAAAAAEAEQARRRADALNLPAVTSLAETNRQLAQARVRLAEQLEEVARQLNAVQAEWKVLQASHDNVRELTQVAKESGVSQEYAIGLALRQEEYSLPSESRFDRDARQRAEQTTTARIQLIRVEKAQEANADLDARLEFIRTSLPEALSSAQRQDALEESARLLQEQQGLLADLAGDYQALVGNLAKLSQAEQAWAEEVAQFKALIAEQVLWFRSTEPLRLGGLQREFTAIYEVVGREIREGLLPWLRRDITQRPFVYAGAALVLLAMLAGRVPLVRGLAAYSAPQSPEGRLSLRPVLLSLLFTVLLTLPIPVVLGFAGWRLADYSGPTPLAEHWSRACWLSASGVLVIELIRQSCRRPGLAVAHLRWPEHNARLLRFHLTWVVLVGVPIGVLSDTLERVFIEGVTNRPLFITGQVLLMFLGHVVFRIRGGLHFSGHSGTAAGYRPLRLQGLYHGLAVLIPLGLLTASLLGYTYTARQIWMRVGDSIQWGLLVLLVTMMTLHWLTILRRRMAVTKAEARQQAGEEEAAAEPGPDIYQVYSQSRRLFSTVLWIVMAVGLWVIWSDLLPALKKLDRIPVPLLSSASLPAAGPDLPSPVPSTLSPEMGEEPAPESEAARTLDTGSGDFLSVGDVLLAILILLLTLAAGRNLPGFVEMLLLSRIRFRQGEGYAIVTVLRYTVLMVGVVWAVSLLGITWSKVQWLAAAITVGIGFGLQEIFANFVSGLILLFERPVRVGDVITVGDVTGSVTRIQMRATTIRNWDQQELVLPNKDLVTGRVINWTLSDDMTRLAITVGLSYQADVERASQLLLEIAKAHPNVRSDPAPFVAFETFGDSTLNVVLRAYTSITVRLFTTSDLNNAILKRFREAGIEIAYPQRDLHIRSVPAELVAARGLTQDKPAGSDEAGRDLKTDG